MNVTLIRKNVRCAARILVREKGLNRSIKLFLYENCLIQAARSATSNVSQTEIRGPEPLNATHFWGFSEKKLPFQRNWDPILNVFVAIRKN